jgi:hypothetical protein
METLNFKYPSRVKGEAFIYLISKISSLQVGRDLSYASIQNPCVNVIVLVRLLIRGQHECSNRGSKSGGEANPAVGKMARGIRKTLMSLEGRGNRNRLLIRSGSDTPIPRIQRDRTKEHKSKECKAKRVYKAMKGIIQC